MLSLFSRSKTRRVDLRKSRSPRRGFLEHLEPRAMLTGGVTTMAIDGTSGITFHDSCLGSEDSIVAVGTTSYANIGVAHFLSNGSPDTSFGSGGMPGKCPFEVGATILPRSGGTSSSAGRNRRLRRQIRGQSLDGVRSADHDAAIRTRSI